MTGGTTNTTVRVNSLICFNKLIPALDKATILELVLPALEFLTKSDPSPTFMVKKICVYTFKCLLANYYPHYVNSCQY